MSNSEVLGKKIRSGAGASPAYLVVIFAICALLACKAARQCGTFEFSAKPFVSDFGTALPGLIVKLGFNFNPHLCAPPTRAGRLSYRGCQCEQIAFIQLARILDIGTSTYVVPRGGSFGEDQIDRMVKSGPDEGWWVDRHPGALSGFFKQEDDGSFNPDMQLGSNSLTAILIDRPVLQQRPWTLFQAVSAPICIKGDAVCKHAILGYYHWGFLIDPEEVVGPTSFFGSDTNDHSEKLQAAVVAWNAVADKWGKQLIPPLHALAQP